MAVQCTQSEKPLIFDSEWPIFHQECVSELINATCVYSVKVSIYTSNALSEMRCAYKCLF